MSYLIRHTRDHHGSTLILVKAKPSIEVFSTPSIPGLRQMVERSTELREVLVLHTTEAALA